MERSALTAIILEAPAWARIGLTMRDKQMRERAADTIAATIVERLTPQERPDRNQLTLPL